jgi:hypothetical protein
MKRYFRYWILLGFVLSWLNVPVGFCQLDSAYQHLYEVMDKYHKTFDVYTDQDAGGNHFSPSIIGNYNALKMSSGDTTAKPFGTQCIRMNYQDTSPPGINWAGVYWLFPDKNWGEHQGLDISGAERLNFWAKGEKGGEKVEFKMGGVNLYAEPDTSKKNYDSCDLLSTGVRTLSTKWEEFFIDLSKKDSFAVYLNGEAGANNRYFPSGWYNGSNNMKVDPNWEQNPHSGSSCFRVEWTGRPGIDSWMWNGIMWQYPEGNWGEKRGYDLTGASKLTFWARTDEKGLKINFLVGINGKDTCGEVPTGYIQIDPTDSGNWTQHTIDLTGKDLSNVRGGFGFTFNDENDPDPNGCIFYLDDIQFDKPLVKKLNNVIGGFCCAVEKANNPDGCTFYLDNIRYQLSPEAEKARLQQPRFLVSYEATSYPSDCFLRNAAYVYDNALAMIAFMARGTDEDWKRAEMLAKAFNLCHNHDPSFGDGRLRNGYKSGDVFDPVNGNALFPAIWDENTNKMLVDQFSLNTHTGNLAWAVIALSGYYKEGKGKPILDPAVLDSAKSTAIKLANWICDSTCNNALGPPGFLGGFEGGKLVEWKSSEHNLDSFIAFSQLAEIDALNADKWLQEAAYAQTFIDSMWNPPNSYFYAGTDISGGKNRAFYEDVQSWSLLAALYAGAIENIPQRNLDAVNKVIDSCRVEHCGFTGFDFDTDRDGVWFEGTAHMATVFGMLNDYANADLFLQQLRNAQKNSKHSNGKGVVAACHDGLTTGLEWKYLNRLHVGATAWYIFAEMAYNPYTVSVRPPKTLSSLPIHFELSQNYPNPFNPTTTIRYSLPTSTQVTLKVFNSLGQEVATLVNEKKIAGEYEVRWNADYLPSGVYLYRIQAGEYLEIKKCLVLR